MKSFAVFVLTVFTVCQAMGMVFISTSYKLKSPLQAEKIGIFYVIPGLHSSHAEAITEGLESALSERTGLNVKSFTVGRLNNYDSFERVRLQMLGYKKHALMTLVLDSIEGKGKNVKMLALDIDAKGNTDEEDRLRTREVNASTVVFEDKLGKDSYVSFHNKKITLTDPAWGGSAIIGTSGGSDLTPEDFREMGRRIALRFISDGVVVGGATGFSGSASSQPRSINPAPVQQRTYHISREGAQYGPYDYGSIYQMMNEGRLLSNDWAWTDGEEGWLPLIDLINKYER